MPQTSMIEVIKTICEVSVELHSYVDRCNLTNERIREVVYQKCKVEPGDQLIDQVLTINGFKKKSYWELDNNSQSVTAETGED